MIYPPRAEHRITPKLICEFPAIDWLAEPKMNGTALNIICLHERLTIFNRYGKEYKTKISNEEYKAIFPGMKSFIVCGEYTNKALADETGEILRDKFIVWDVTSLEGTDLLGVTVEERMKLLLQHTVKGKKSKKVYLQKEISENIGIIKTIDTNFEKSYDKLTQIPIIEGLILKRRNAPLKPFNRADNNTDWQVKVRKATKCYKF